MFTYATTDIGSVETVSSTLETPALKLELSENSTLVRDSNIETLEQSDYIVIEQKLEVVKQLEHTKEPKIIEVKTIKEPVITQVNQSEALLYTEVADANYTGCKVELTPEDRDLLERLVQGEAGGEGYEGAALVAQAIRDALVYRGFNSVAEIRIALKYSGSIENPPNDNVKKAVAYIFDDGGVAVKHKIYYFYAPKKCTSSFHESQKFIVEHKGHRFFSTY